MIKRCTACATRLLHWRAWVNALRLLGDLRTYVLEFPPCADCDRLYGPAPLKN